MEIGAGVVFQRSTVWARRLLGYISFCFRRILVRDVLLSSATILTRRQTIIDHIVDAASHLLHHSRQTRHPPYTTPSTLSHFESILLKFQGVTFPPRNHPSLRDLSLRAEISIPSTPEVLLLPPPHIRERLLLEINLILLSTLSMLSKALRSITPSLTRSTPIAIAARMSSSIPIPTDFVSGFRAAIQRFSSFRPIGQIT